MHRAFARTTRGLLATIVGLGLTAALPAVAAPTRTVAYSGELAQNGRPFAGTAALTFFIVNDPAHGRGAALWSETHPTVNVRAGTFEVELGTITAFPAALFDSPMLYVGIEVNGTPLAGRQRLVSAPAAITTADANDFTVRGTLSVNGNATTQGTFTAQGDITSDTAVTASGTGGSASLRAPITPQVAFRSDAAGPIDAIIQLTDANTLRVDGARLHASGGLSVGTYDVRQPTLDCTCVSGPTTVVPIGGAAATATLPAGYARTGGGCHEGSGGERQLLLSRPHDNGVSWVCHSVDEDNPRASALSAWVCGCRLQ